MVVFGTTLISTPLIERIINAVLEKKFTLSLTESNDVQVGLWLIGIGLFYNLLTNYFDKYLLHIQTIKKLENNSSQDKILYKKFLQTLPSNGSVEFIKYHDFHNSFALDNLRQLINFSEEWINAEHEFMNQELETLRKNLLEKIQHFVYDSSMKTYSIGDGIQTIMNNRDEDWNLTQVTQDNIVLLNNYGNNIYDLHQDLVRIGRDLLHI